MGLFSRLYSLVRGSFSKTVKDWEWRSPETVLEEAENQKRRRVTELIDALSRFRTALDLRRERIKKMLVDLQTVEDRLAIAVDRKDMRNGPELLRQQRQLSDQIRIDQGELDTDIQRQSALEAALKAVRDDIERFRVQRHRITAEIRALQAQRQAQTIEQQFFTEAQSGAIDGVLQRLHDERNRADLIAETAGTSPVGMHALDRHWDDQAFAAMCGQNDSGGSIRTENSTFARLADRRMTSMGSTAS